MVGVYAANPAPRAVIGGHAVFSKYLACTYWDLGKIGQCYVWYMTHCRNANAEHRLPVVTCAGRWAVVPRAKYILARCGSAVGSYPIPSQ
jgi:hypothetical protein